MGRYVKCWIGLAVVLLACVPAKSFGSVERTELKGDELRAVEESLGRMEPFRKATARTEDQRLYRVSSSKYRISEDGRPAQAIAEVVYFRYQGGITIRATVGLETMELLKLEELKAYPTPLADEELAQAVTLAKKESPAFRSLYAGAGEKNIELDHLAPVVSNPEDPRYGHRLVILMVAPRGKPEGVVKVEIDLTRGTVKPLESATAADSSGEAR
jgi:hypothetical protein